MLVSIAKNLKYDEYQHKFASIVFFSFFDKKTASGAATLANKAAVKMENITKKNLAEELHKPVIRKYWKKSTFTSYRQSLAADLPDIQLISKFNKGFRFLLCVIDIYNKYTFIIKNCIIKT